MNTILIAVISVSIIGFFCSALITVASKVMFVKADERVQKIRDCLPGANCGACGLSGCDAYAEALVKGDAASNLCPPGGNTVYEQINEILGLNTDEGLEKKTAVVHCLGDCETMKNKMEYIGIKTCLAASKLFGGQGACTFGCIGFGDCAGVCPADAICVSDGLARVDPRKCIGCAICIKACPSNVISMHRDPVKVAILCKNIEKGAVIRKKCSKGCIGCIKCVKECPAEAITVDEFLAVIDYSLCDGCRKCVDVCIAKCII